MTRLVFLYAPAAVCGALALVITIYGRSDGIVIGGATALALALVGHTIQEVHETRRPDLEPAARRATWLPERWYRDLWLLAISIVVVIGVFNADEQGDDIQAQRRASILTACREQNARHDDTIVKLDKIIADLPPGPQKDEALQQRDGTVLLIDALAPKRDCEAQLQRSTTTPTD